VAEGFNCKNTTSHYHAEEKHMILALSATLQSFCPQSCPLLLTPESVAPIFGSSLKQPLFEHHLVIKNLQCSLELMVISVGMDLKKLPSIPSNWGFCTSNLRHKSRDTKLFQWKPIAAGTPR